MKNKKRKSFANRILRDMLAAGIVIVLIVLAITYITMRSYLMDQVKDSSRSYAMAAANQVDGDIFAALDEESVENDDYMQIYNLLSAYLSSDQVEYIYTMKEMDGEMVFVIDTDPEDPADFFEEYEDTCDEMYEAIKTGVATCDSEITSDEWGSYISGYAPIKDSSGKIVGLVGVDYNAETISDDCKQFVKKILFVGLLCCIMCIGLGIVLSMSLKKRLKLVNDKLSDVVYNDGDLNRKVEIHTDDEFEDLADNLNAMMDQTRGVVSNVKTCSGRIHNVANEVDETMGEARDKVQVINDYMQEMSEGIDLTVESLESIRQMMDEVAESVEEVNEKAAQGTEVASEISEKSNEMTSNAVRAQRAIKEQIDDIRARLDNQLEKAKKAEQIKNFTDDILNIADETQMLSLNASIEAARAGEAGRGFSVVAENIGKLAVSSGEAAENIQYVSTEVIEVVEDLSVLSRQIVGFIEAELLPQFQEFTQSGEQYVEYAGMISRIMNQFDEKMSLVDKAVDDVQNAVEKVAEASANNQEHIIEVSDYAGKLNQQMGHTVDMSQMNKEQADNLSKVVERYTVE